MDKDPKATANAIEKILLDEELRGKLSVNARNFVLDKYNWKENFKLITEIYKEAIKGMNNA